MSVELEDLLEFTVENNASDLHLSSGLPPMIRIDGEIRRLSAAPLASSQILKMIYGIILGDKFIERQLIIGFGILITLGFLFAFAFPL